MLQRFTALFPAVFSQPRGFYTTMNISEAKKILNIEHPKQDILERYRKLMKINHPDRGGSPYIASKINEAKNILMKNGY